ncbi:MAG: dynamin family protein [Bacteroidales bacterium]|nr:dynamin family protein [Bacteroidales bacterium]
MMTTIAISVASVMLIAFVVVLIGRIRDKKDIEKLSSELRQSKAALNTTQQPAIASTFATLPANASSSEYVEQIKKLQDELQRSNSALKSAQSNEESNKNEIAKLKDKLEKAKQNLADASKSSGDSADITKLKEKIKKLEDKLEDAEDDVDSMKKKIKKVESEKNEALYDMERELKNANSELSNVKDKLKDANDTIKLNGKSLEFVQKILSAELDKSTNFVSTLKKIDDLRDFINIDLRSWLKEHVTGFLDSPQAKEIFGPAQDQWAEVAAKNWVNGKIKIAFVGEFSAGKSSIVNRIITKDNPNAPKLPVNNGASTAIPTYISKGITYSFSFYTPSNELKSIEEIEDEETGEKKSIFSDINHEILDQIGSVSSLIKYLVIQYNDDNFTGLSILDTPGFSHDNTDNANTLSVINECDALFWVVDVNNGEINKSSLNLIAKHLQKPLYVIVNKVDTVSQSQANSVQRKIEQTFRDKGMSIRKIIQFHKNAKLDELMSTIKSIGYDNSSERYLSTVQSTCKSILSQFNSAKKQAKEEYKNAKKDVKDCEDAFYNNGNLMIKQAGELIDFVESCFDTHVFRSDSYEMTEYQYDNIFKPKLFDMLDPKDDESTLNYMDRCFVSYKEAVKTDTETYSNQQDIVHEYKEFENIIQRLNKLIDALNSKTA